MLLAASPDGTAAISLDDLGGARLWPALDGSIEPRVIDLPSATQLAVRVVPRGFELGLVDDAGGLTVETIDRDGALLERATLPLEPRYRAIAMTSRGLVGWRADQLIVRVGDRGAIAERLAVAAGQRVLAIAVATAADRAIAVIEGGTDKLWRRARWFATDKLAWGAWVKDAGDEVGTEVAVAPHGKRFVYLSDDPRAPTMTVIGGPTGPTEQITLRAMQTPVVAMPDDDHAVVASQSSMVQWYDLTNSAQRSSSHVRMVSGGVLCTGGGKLITGLARDLAISTPTKNQFLGYGITAPTAVAAAPGGRLAIAFGDHAVVLDRELREKPLDVIAKGDIVVGLRWLAGDGWLVSTTRARKAAVDLVAPDGTRTQVRGGLAVPAQLAYDPSTQLVGLSGGPRPAVMRYVPASHRLEPVGEAREPDFTHLQLWPVPPATAQGIQLVSAERGDKLTLRWVRDAHALETGTTYTTRGGVTAVDATGRAYVVEPAAGGGFEIVLVRDGKRIGTLATPDKQWAISPDPTGQRVITSGDTGLTMLGVDGTQKWSQSLAGVSAVRWLDDGTIAAVTAIGIARFDARTGKRTALRCGWQFGLSDEIHIASMRVEPLCTAP